MAVTEMKEGGLGGCGGPHTTSMELGYVIIKALRLPRKVYDTRTTMYTV